MAASNQPTLGSTLIALAFLVGIAVYVTYCPLPGGHQDRVEPIDTGTDIDTGVDTGYE